MAATLASRDWRTFTEAIVRPAAEALGLEVSTALAGAVALVALTLAVVIGFAVLRRPRARTACRWKRDGLRPETRLRRWVCVTCGVDAYTATGKSPKECKRTSRPVGL